MISVVRDTVHIDNGDIDAFQKLPAFCGFRLVLKIHLRQDNTVHTAVGKDVKILPGDLGIAAGVADNDIEMLVTQPALKLVGERGKKGLLESGRIKPMVLVVLVTRPTAS